jgi:hypothetical protein
MLHYINIIYRPSHSSYKNYVYERYGLLIVMLLTAIESCV